MLKESMIINQNIRRVSILLLIGLCFIISGTFMLDYVITHSNDADISTIKLLKYKYLSIPILAFGVTLSILITLTYLLRLIKATPILTISKEGITEYSTIASVGFVPWANIKNTSILNIGQQTFITIIPKNIKKTIRKLPKYKRFIILLTIRMRFSPIAINLNSVKEKPEDILAIMNKYWDEWKKNNEQEKI